MPNNEPSESTDNLDEIANGNSSIEPSIYAQASREKVTLARSLTFDLTLPYEQTEIPVSLLVAKGNTKDDAIACFEELESMNYGIFDRGTQGRGKMGKFIPNENCPNKYEMTISVKKKGRPKKLIENSLSEVTNKVTEDKFFANMDKLEPLPEPPKSTSKKDVTMRIDSTFPDKLYIRDIQSEVITPFVKALLEGMWMDHDIPSSHRSVGDPKKLTLAMLPWNYSFDPVVEAGVSKGIISISQIGSVFMSLRMCIIKPLKADGKYDIEIERFQYESNGFTLLPIVKKVVTDFTA